ncbi:hypothetical protein BDB01DRAFT_253383 [Pilobolus umbonatus]|nr:hypothetical protein BDB01DRAFT_253383 [Pilobolus umbonatus]
MVMNNMWRAVAKYTRQQIVQSEPTKIDHILKLWHMRLLALIKLNLCQLAAAELEKLGDLDRSELIDPHTQESMVPYALWILWARLPSYLKQVSVTLERLTMLAVKCMKLKKKNDARREIWAHREVQTYLVLATHLICIKDYTTAAKVMESILHQVPDQVDILSGLGRLYLQMGDMDKANQIFHHLESVVGEKEHVKETVGINQSFLSMAQGDWLSARDRLQKIYDSNKENLLVMSNLAVCEVYLGNLLKAIELLEALTRENPSSAGTCETAITNICTLYELRYEDATSKKVEIMKQVSRWAGDSFQQDCIKLK